MTGAASAVSATILSEIGSEKLNAIAQKETLFNKPLK
jgi:hypothetical protein